MYKSLAGALTASILLLGGTGSAQKSIPCVSSTRFQIVDQTFWSIMDTSVEAHYTIPAQFPKPAVSKKVNIPFTMKCPGFTAVSKKGDFTLMGDVGKNFQKLISFWHEGDPDTTSYIPGMVDLGYYGYFTYANIREDWNQERLALSLTGGRLKLSYEGYQVFLKDLIVGYRINSGSLQPAYFENKLSQIKHGPRDIVEIYVKGEEAQLSYLKIDFKNQKIIVRHQTSFPSK